MIKKKTISIQFQHYVREYIARHIVRPIIINLPDLHTEILCKYKPRTYALPQAQNLTRGQEEISDEWA
jgi:hypothetical protein